MEEGIYREVGANIRERRVALGWSLQSLGRFLRVSYQQLQKYEKGTNRLPTHMLVLLAAKFGCSTDELCGVQPKAISVEGMRAVQLFGSIESAAVRREVLKLIEAVVELADRPVDAGKADLGESS